MGNPFKLMVVLVAVLVLGLIAALLLLTRSPAQTDTRPRAELPYSAVTIREEVPAGTASATFAGGCFWCVEAAFQETPGVTNAISGYAGGTEFEPRYEHVYKGLTGHREAIRVYYRPNKISYSDLLDVFWRTIDPTDPDGQFVDRGFPYTTAIFPETAKQRSEAESSKQELADSGRFTEPIATEIIDFTTFYEAEDYHQDFYLKSSERYKNYEQGSGREEFKAQVWAEIERQMQ